MSKQVSKQDFRAALESACASRIATLQADNEVSAVAKMSLIAKDALALADTLYAYRVDAAEVYATEALYALQKVNKLAAALAANSARSIDQYTKAILTNAFARSDLTLQNEQCAASCSNRIEYASADLLVRCLAHSTTATTQASSTRRALAAFKCAALAKHSVTLVECKALAALRAMLAAS